MITEKDKHMVYFSKWMKADYPSIYNEICEILDTCGVDHDLLLGTEDYWCRDYMPVQIDKNGHFVQFVYSPDYLKDDAKYMTDTDNVLKKMDFDDSRFQVKKSQLVVDGGNIVVCEGKSQQYVVMTDKVMNENPTYTREQIEQMLIEAFATRADGNIPKIVWLPWDPEDKCGHTDGILRYVGINADGNPVVLTNLSLYENKYAVPMRNILNGHFEVVELTLSQYDENSWAYINCLQTDSCIIVPGIGNPITDKEALEQIKSLYPQYKDKVYQVQMKNLITKWGGALNCCTWTVTDNFKNK